MPLFSKYSTFLIFFFWLKSAKRPTSFNVVPPSERFSSLDFDDSEKLFRNNQGTWTMKRFWREFQLNHKTRTNRGKNNITVSIHSCEVRRSLQSNFFLNPDIDSLRWSETALAFSILLLINPTCVSWRRPFESWVVCLLLLPQPNSIPSSKNVPPFFLCPLTSPLPSLQRRLGLQVSRLSIAPGLSLIISLYGNQSSGFLFSWRLLVTLLHEIISLGSTLLNPTLYLEHHLQYFFFFTTEHMLQIPRMGDGEGCRGGKRISQQDRDWTCSVVTQTQPCEAPRCWTTERIYKANRI